MLTDNFVYSNIVQLMHSLDGDDHSINTHTANLNVNTPRASKSTSHQASPSEALHNAVSAAAMSERRRSQRSRSVCERIRFQ